MKKFTLFLFAVFVLLTLNSCGAIETIFKAGMWWAFFLIGAVIAVIVWLFTRGKN